MLTKISSMLDAIADSLEKKGLVKEAYEIDKVADICDHSKISGKLGSVPVTLKSVLNDHALPVPPVAIPYLEKKLYYHEYNHEWYNDNVHFYEQVTSDYDSGYKSYRTKIPNIFTLRIDKDHLEYSNGNWKYIYKHVYKPETPVEKEPKITPTSPQFDDSPKEHPSLLKTAPQDNSYWS